MFPKKLTQKLAVRLMNDIHSAVAYYLFAPDESGLYNIGTVDAEGYTAEHRMWTVQLFTNAKLLLERRGVKKLTTREWEDAVMADLFGGWDNG